MTSDDIRKQFDRIDFAMLAAAFVEVPRWAVAFAAIREPMWAAVPMGLLLAWAASAGWKAYFEQRTRILLLCINVASLLGALVVIAPVLYAMTYMPLDAIDLSAVLPPRLLWIWAAVLAVTTFVPLVQVAAVKAYHARPATPTPPVTVGPAAPIAVRVASPAAVAPDVAPDVALDDALSMYAADAVADLLQPDARTRALQLLSEGYSATDVAREVGAKPATVRSWQRRATAQRNGGAA